MAQNTRIQNNPLWTKTIHNDQPRHPKRPKMAYNHLVNDKNTWTIVDIETKVFYYFPKKLQDMMVKKQTWPNDQNTSRNRKHYVLLCD